RRCDERAGRHQKHLQPEGKAEEFTRRLTHDHQEAGGQQHAESTGQPGSESRRGFQKRLIPTRPPQDVCNVSTSELKVWASEAKVSPSETKVSAPECRVWAVEFSVRAPESRVSTLPLRPSTPEFPQP